MNEDSGKWMRGGVCMTCVIHSVYAVCVNMTSICSICVYDLHMCMTCICWRSRSASWRCSSIALDPDSSHTPRSEKMQDMSKERKSATANGRFPAKVCQSSNVTTSTQSSCISSQTHTIMIKTITTILNQLLWWISDFTCLE